MYGSNNCYAIGLTGGIASGKTAVSDGFEALGCAVIDADIIAREVVEPGSEGLNQVAKHFGKSIINQEGQLDRSALRRVVFNDDEKRTQLNAILHPLIQQRIHQLLQQVEQPFCFVVIPLLCESDQYDWLDRVLVVDVPPKVQLQRLMKRDGITETLAKKMMYSQCSRQQRLAIADDVVKNDQTLADLKKHINTLHDLYQYLARRHADQE